MITWESMEPVRVGISVTDTQLGGPVDIHGLGSVPRDFTFGFYALRDADMDWLYDSVVARETAVLILP